MAEGTTLEDSIKRMEAQLQRIQQFVTSTQEFISESQKKLGEMEKLQKNTDEKIGNIEATLTNQVQESVRDRIQEERDRSIGANDFGGDLHNRINKLLGDVSKAVADTFKSSGGEEAQLLQIQAIMNQLHVDLNSIFADLEAKLKKVGEGVLTVPPRETMLDTCLTAFNAKFKVYIEDLASQTCDLGKKHTIPLLIATLCAVWVKLPLLKRKKED